MHGVAIVGGATDELVDGTTGVTVDARRRDFPELFFYAILPLVDFGAVSTAFVIADAFFGRAGLGLVLILIPLWVLLFALVGLYAQTGVRNSWDEISKTFVAVSAGMMLLIAADYLNHSLFPSRTVLVYGYVLSFALVVSGRHLVRAARHALFARDLGVHRVVMIGTGPVAQRMTQALNQTRRTGYQVVGAIDDGALCEPLAGIPVFGSLEEMERGLGRAFDELIEADSHLPPDEIVRMVRFATEHQLEYRFVLHRTGVMTRNTVMSSLAGLPVVRIRQTPLEGWGRIVKRVFDIVGAAIGIVLLSPLFLAVTILIKCLDPGPVFFRQLRLGCGGEPFYIWKFRTMMMKYSGRPPLEVFRELGREDLIEEFEIEHKVKNDPRVSRVGAFLRTTSLDELPQLWNALLGQLSLVGPRPIVHEEVPKFGEAKATILALQPGITGPWQTCGRNDISYPERVRLNIEYVQNWSLLLDIRILLKTIVILASRGGAY